MTQPIARDSIYRGRRFQSETIELCVRWYITYRLSYRDLAAMMLERGIAVSHTTILRWVLRYVPEYERRWNRYATRVGSSWRMDETAVSVRGGLHYLYRAVDKDGKSVASLLRADRGMDAAQEFFRRAVAANRSRLPRKTNLDGNAASHRAMRLPPATPRSNSPPSSASPAAASPTTRPRAITRRWDSWATWRAY